MQLVTFRCDSGVRFGIHRDGMIVDLTEVFGGRVGSVRELLAAPGALAEAAELSGPIIDAGDIIFLPPVPDPGKIIGAALNYRDHRDQAAQKEVEFPTLFARWPDTQIGHLAPVVKPTNSEQLDFEGELAVVIGKTASQVPAEEAYSYVAGYSCYNDLSVRDWQMRTTQWLPGKSFPGTGAFGPYLVTADEVGDIEQVTLSTMVNGEVRQAASVGDMLFSIPVLIEYITAFTVLSPGDVIISGTPSGVGLFRDPPVFLQPGDDIEVTVTKVGTLRNQVVVA